MMTKVDFQPKLKQRPRVYLCALLFLLIAQFTFEASNVLAQQNIVAPQALTLNANIKGVISDDDSPTYTINLSVDDYLKIEILATKIDVKVIDPAGQVVADRASDNRRLTPLSIVAKTPGQHLLVLRRLQEDRNLQHFTLRATELRRLSSADSTRIEAERVFTEATRLSRKSQTQSSDKVLKLFQLSQKLWTAVEDIEGESLALLALGETYEALDQSIKALACYETALPLTINLQDKRREMEALARLTGHYVNAGESSKAVEYGNRTLELARQLQDKHIEAETLNYMGEAQYELGNLPRAVDYHKQSFALFNAIGDAPSKARVNINLGYAYLNLGESEKAKNSYHEALVLANQSSDRELQALTYRALGNLYTKTGQSQRALDAFRKALGLIEQSNGKLLKARVLAGIGHAYVQLRDWEKALAYDGEAVDIFQQLGNKWGEAELRMDLGGIHYYRNDTKQALSSYERALSLFRELGMTRFESQTLSSIGLVYASLGDHTKAFDYYTRSLHLTRSGQDQRYAAYTLNYLGELYLATGKHTAALQNFRDALSLNQQASDPVGEAMTLYNLARLARNMGSLSEAANYSEEALKIIESVRMAVAGDKLRASFGASVHQQYELSVDILMRQHQQNPFRKLNVAALEVSERGRARSWLESLRETRAEIREGVDQPLLDRADDLQKKIDAKSQDQIRLMMRPQTEKEEQALARELRKLASDYEEVQGQIQANSQRYALTTGPAPLSGQQLQQQIDSDSLLLEFSLGEDHSYAWVISPEWIKSVELPGRKVLEPICRRLYQALAARTHEGGGPTPGYAEDDAEVEHLSKELGQILLTPMRDLLRQKRLIIVADGALQYVPFEVLVYPAAADQTSHQPLVANHEIVYLPSASVIAEQRVEFNNRPLAPKMLKIFADPVFDETDDRIDKKRSSSRKSTRPGRESSGVRLARKTNRSTDTRNLLGVSETPSLSALRAAGFDQGIPRLPFSNQEARRIISLVPPGQGVAALGFDANRNRATSDELAQYRFVHFATHGLLNSEHPELSGILLSMVDHNGSSQNGFLQLHEIYNMHLPIELVVLSACQTALGKEVRGEGLFGLTRGFMYVGAKRAVSSLWKVNDSATAELMELFYKEMLLNERSPAAALQSAKNNLRKQKRWQEPFYWAGFIMQGEWK